MSLTAGSGPFGKKPAGPVPYRLRALVAGETLVDTRDAKMLHETGHLPVYYVPLGDLRHDRYYFPPEGVRLDLLEPSEKKTRCAYKGSASRFHARIGDERHDDVAWT